MEMHVEPHSNVYYLGMFLSRVSSARLIRQHLDHVYHY